MLGLLPAPLHRRLYKIAYRVRHRFRRVVRLPIFGVNAIIRDQEERVLLVRHSYGPAACTLPGGGHSQREDPANAARREVREELSIEIENLELLATLKETLSGAPHTSSLFAGYAVGEPRPDGREIIAAEFFAREDLPVLLQRRIEVRLDLWYALLDRKNNTG